MRPGVVEIVHLMAPWENVSMSHSSFWGLDSTTEVSCLHFSVVLLLWVDMTWVRDQGQLSLPLNQSHLQWSTFLKGTQVKDGN